MHIKKRHIHEALEEAALLFQQGALQQARAVLAAILKADSRQAEALHLLGLLAGRAGNLAEAYEHLQRAVKIDPDRAEYHNSLGVVLRKLDRLSDAERSYRRCLKLEPDHVEALDNLATLLRHTKRAAEAVPYCRRALKLNPGDSRLLANLAGALAERGDVREPRQLFDLLAKHSDRQIVKAALIGLHGIAVSTGDIDAVVEHHQQIFKCCDPYYNHSSYLFHLNYSHRFDQKEIYEHHLSSTTVLANVNAPELFKPTLDTNKRPLRVGYVTPELVCGSVGMLLTPVLQCHDPAAVFSVVYDTHMRGGQPLAESKAACGLWRDCRSSSNKDLAQLIRDDAIDILIDVTGHCADNRITLFAGKCAPVQVSWLGYFNTTGLRQMDWLISDVYSTPPGEEQYYTERIWRMPHFRFPVVLKPTELSGEVPRPTGKTIFVSNNNLIKLTQPVLQAWARILAAVPDAILVVRWKSLASEEIRDDFRQRFSAVGGDSSRLQMPDPIGDHDAFMATYADADIMLDSFPFGGGITSLDALAMGVPVVTLPSDRMAGRQTQAFLELAGHHDLIAKDWDDYVRIAIQLASDSQRLQQLRETLRDDLLRSPLCDVKQFTRDLEAAYRFMWNDRCRQVS